MRFLKKWKKVIKQKGSYLTQYINLKQQISFHIFISYKKKKKEIYEISYSYSYLYILVDM